MKKKDFPKDYIPSVKDAKWFLDYWKNHPSYSNQEKALDKLFMDICKKNDNIEDILIKCSSLNDFYSTNIFDIHTVSQHILSLHIDARLENGDHSLVNDIAHVEVICSSSTFAEGPLRCSPAGSRVPASLGMAILDIISFASSMLPSQNMRGSLATARAVQIVSPSFFQRA